MVELQFSLFIYRISSFPLYVSITVAVSVMHPKYFQNLVSRYISNQIPHETIPVFPLPGWNLFAEILVLCLLVLCESLRIFFGWKGNLTARSAPLAVAVAMIVPGVLGVLFFLLWQVRCQKNILRDGGWCMLYI